VGFTEVYIYEILMEDMVLIFDLKTLIEVSEGVIYRPFYILQSELKLKTSRWTV
jgi:hypothetical protein